MQLQAAHAALAGFGRSLSRAAAEQLTNSGGPTQVGSESRAWEVPAGHDEKGVSSAVLEDCEATRDCAEEDSVGRQSSSYSMEGANVAPEVVARSDSSASEEVGAIISPRMTLFIAFI